MRVLVSVLLGLVLIAGAYFASNKIKDSKQPPRGQVPTVTNLVFAERAENQDLPTYIKTNGTIAAQERIELFSEVQGVLKPSNTAFKAGQRYKKGALLLEMDSQEFFSSLIAQRSVLYNNIVLLMPDLKFDIPESFQQWQDYLDTFNIEEKVKELPEPLNDKEKYFINAKQIVSTYYSIKNLEERLVKYEIKAPFSGILTEALVDPGTLIRPGQKLGELINPSIFELEANINAEYLEYLKIGKKVAINDLQGRHSWTGFVKRINGIIDPTTQTVQAFIQLSGSYLTEGMFLEASVMAQTESNVLEIDRALLFENNNIFVIKQDTILSSVPVEVVNFSDKTVKVRGIQNGTLILSRPLPGAYDGMIVKVSNQQ